MASAPSSFPWFSRVVVQPFSNRQSLQSLNLSSFIRPVLAPDGILARDIGIRYRLDLRRPVGIHEAARAAGVVAGLEVVVAGFGVAFLVGITRPDAIELLACSQLSLLHLVANFVAATTQTTDATNMINILMLRGNSVRPALSRSESDSPLERLGPRANDTTIIAVITMKVRMP